MEALHAAGILGVVFCQALAFAQEPFAPREELRGLERIAGEIARSGRPDEWGELLSTLANLGLPSKDLATLRAAGEKDLARAKKRSADTSRIRKAITDAAALLSKRLATCEPEERKLRFAELLCALDSNLAVANETLRRELHEGRWSMVGESKRAQRRNEINRALQDARRLPVDIQVLQSRGDEPDAEKTGGALLARVLQRPFVTAKYGGLVVHSARTPEQTKRILEHTLRAHAVASYVAGGALRIADPKPTFSVMLDSKVDYETAIRVAKQGGWIDDKTAAQAPLLAGFYTENKVLVDLAKMEADSESALLVDLDEGRFTTPALTAGHLNWVCKAFLGTSIPSYSYETTTERSKKPPSTLSGDPRALLERETAFHLAQAGLAGSRTFIRYLAAHREDPPWSNAMKSQIGEIQGEDLLKAMLVAEYLMEESDLKKLDELLRKLPAGGSIPERIEKAMGEPLPTFEERWRQWIVGFPEGLAQKLAVNAVSMDPADATALGHLNGIRIRAFEGAAGFVRDCKPITLDVELSNSCRAHAMYLENHPEMAAKWPDAHEENPEHADWSAVGAWAGGHSVIAPGDGDGLSAIESWMGTFYHRLPLIDPGLLRVGLGISGDCVVMDSGSMVEFINEDWHVGWPPENATNVPTRFVPELPNPVPGEDQSKFGYPITLQVGVSTDGSEVEVDMRLLDGTEVVPCWFSSPQKPTYVELAPAGAFCLIPKQRLRSSTTYTVEAVFRRDQKRVAWTFRTGSK